jgi:hypothetical protein
VMHFFFACAFSLVFFFTIEVVGHVEVLILCQWYLLVSTHHSAHSLHMFLLTLKLVFFSMLCVSYWSIIDTCILFNTHFLQ